MVINIHTPAPAGSWGYPIVYCPGSYFPGGTWVPTTLPPLARLSAEVCARQEVYAIEIKPYRFDNDRIYELTGAGTDEFSVT